MVASSVGSLTPLELWDCQGPPALLEDFPFCCFLGHVPPSSALSCPTSGDVCLQFHFLQRPGSPASPEPAEPSSGGGAERAAPVATSSTCEAAKTIAVQRAACPALIPAELQHSQTAVTVVLVQLWLSPLLWLLGLSSSSTGEIAFCSVFSGWEGC